MERICTVEGVAGVVDPLHILADLEGPYGVVLVMLPAFGHGGNVVTVDVGLYQTVNAVGSDLAHGSVRGREVVERRIRRREVRFVGRLRFCTATAQAGGKHAKHESDESARLKIFFIAEPHYRIYDDPL